MSLIIDPEFKAAIPPLRPEELAGLERSILADGCRDPLVVWGDTLVDGHNRYSICQKHRLPYDVMGMQFSGIRKRVANCSQAD